MHFGAILIYYIEKNIVKWIEINLNGYFWIR